jgi:hypothetical protein
MSLSAHVPDVPKSQPAVARRPWVPPALTLESMRHVAAKRAYPLEYGTYSGPAS